MIRSLIDWDGVTEAKFLGITLLENCPRKYIMLLEVLEDFAYFALVHTRCHFGLGHSAEATKLFALQMRAVRIVAGLGYGEDCRQTFYFVITNYY